MFPELLVVPTLTCLPDGYAGLPSNELSRIDAAFLAELWADEVPTHAQVMAGVPLAKPRLCGVAARWAASDA
jgi:hypothetical protein